jgi:hypothetical protein
MGRCREAQIAAEQRDSRRATAGADRDVDRRTFRGEPIAADEWMRDVPDNVDVVWQVPYTNEELGQETVEVMSRFSYGTSTNVLSVLVLPPKSNSDRSAWMVVPESSGTKS